MDHYITSTLMLPTPMKGVLLKSEMDLEQDTIRLLEYSLLICTKCEHSSQYIDQIIGLEETVQTELMNIVGTYVKEEQADSDKKPTKSDEIARMESEMSSLEADNAKVTLQIKELEQECANLKNTNNELCKKNAKLEMDLSKESEKTKTNTFNPRSSDINSYGNTSDLMAIISEKDTTISSLKEEMVQIHKTYQLKEAADKDELETVQIQLMKSQKDAQLLPTLQEKLNSLEEVRDQFEELHNINDRHQIKISELEKRLKDTEESLCKANELKKQINECNMQLSTLKASIEERTRDNEYLNNEKALSEKNSKKMEETIKQLVDENNALKLKMPTTNSLSLEVEQKIMKLEDKVRQLTIDNEELKKSQSNSELKLINSDLQGRLEQTCCQLKAQDVIIADYNEKVKSMQTKNDLLNGQLIMLKGSTQELSTKAYNYENVMAQNAILTKKYDEMTKLIEENTKIKEETEKLKQDNISQRAEIQKLYEEKRSIDQRYFELSNEKNKESKELHEAIVKSKFMESEATSRSKEIEGLKKFIDEKTGRISSLESNNKELQIKSDYIQNTLNSQTEDRRVIEEELNKKIVSLRQSLKESEEKSAKEIEEIRGTSMVELGKKQQEYDEMIKKLDADINDKENQLESQECIYELQKKILSMAVLEAGQRIAISKEMK